jgi:superfamily II DNA or RNA helicase
MIKGGYKADNQNTKREYINFGINGRLFPSWVLANFKHYKLPEVFVDGTDPCNEKKTGNELRKYQEFLGKYLDYNSPYRNILIYHGLGSGKTRTAINIYNILYNSSPDWNIFILLKATMKDSVWKKQLDMWLEKDEKDFRNRNIIYVSYDAPNADKQFLEKVMNSDSAKKSMYIIDEVHNFINNVYTNLKSKQGRRALTIYEHIISEKRDNDQTRVIAISGSPAINNPYELAILFNLLRPGTFPKSETEFNQLYVIEGLNPMMNPSNKNNFQRRIIGLVSFYIGATKDYYAKKIEKIVDVRMSEYQTEVYDRYEAIEEKIMMKKKTSQNYMTYTRQASNFVFPVMKQGYDGDTRPRPRDFKIKEEENKLIDRYMGKSQNVSQEIGKEKYYEANKYIEKMESFLNEFNIFLRAKLDQDIRNKYTMADDIDIFFKKTGKEFTANDIEEFIENNSKSSLLRSLYDCSAKMITIILNILVSPGPVLVYSNYILMEGFGILKIYLKYFGFSQMDSSGGGGEDYLRYTEYHGGYDMDERRRNLDNFNEKENHHGKICKIIMISAAGAEGLSLENTRQVHIMEPYWHEIRIIQMIGRAIRQCSHKDIPMEERVVVVFRYRSIKHKSGKDKMTTDQIIDDLSRGKQVIINSFLEAIREVAVDCVLNKAHNETSSKGKCFQFTEKSLFDTHIGPAFKEDLHDDMKMNNGLNSPNTIVKRIKVVKIKAVKQLKEEGEENEKFSEPDFYWYNPESYIVYDYDVQYPVGMVGIGSDNIPMKRDSSTYIINKLVPIPMIRKRK